MAKILSVYNRLQAGDYENGNGGKRRVSRLTQVYPRNASIVLILVAVYSHSSAADDVAAGLDFKGGAGTP